MLESPELGSHIGRTHMIRIASSNHFTPRTKNSHCFKTNGRVPALRRSQPASHLPASQPARHSFFRIATSSTPSASIHSEITSDLSIRIAPHYTAANLAHAQRIHPQPTLRTHFAAATSIQSIKWIHWTSGT